MNNFIVGQVTPSMLTHIGYGTFVFFGVSFFIHLVSASHLFFLTQAFSFLGAFFIMFFVPETKGLTLEEMDDVFGDREGLAVADQQRQNAIADRIGLTAYNSGKHGTDVEKSSHEHYDDHGKA